MRTLIAMCFGVLAACGAANAQSSTDLIKVHFATPVMVDGTSVPAGDVFIHMQRGSGHVDLLVRSESGVQVLVPVSRINEATADDKAETRIVLSRTGDRYSLEQVWVADGMGFQLP